VAAAFAWDSFPTCTWPYFQTYAPPKCDFGVVPGRQLNQTNACLCSNQLFLTSAAVAIYTGCGCVDLSTSAEQLITNCNSLTDTPIVLTADEFISIGDGNQSSCTQSISTGSNTSAKSGPNVDLIVGLVVDLLGGLIIFLALLVAIIQLLVTHKKLDANASPWPLIRESFRDWCCCCIRRPRKGTQQVNQQPVPLVPVNVP
jgi:hypothetical protein